MNIKRITFCFENCEWITIDGKYIGDMDASDIRKSVCRVACNAVEEIETANFFAVEIHKDANKEEYAFGIKNEEYKTYTFDRFLKYNDITDIHIELYDEYGEEKDETYKYLVDWVGEDEYSNPAQKTYLSKCGNLYIVVSNERDIADCFSIERIDDKEYMNFHFQMLDVGNNS